MVMIMEDDMPIEELSKKAFKCLVDNFGYFNATNYIASLIDEGRNSPPDYTEWRQNYDNMTDDEFMADLNDYIKNHPHE